MKIPKRCRASWQAYDQVENKPNEACGCHLGAVKRLRVIVGHDADTQTSRDQGINAIVVL